ncbi:MAG: ATP-dependent DNA ligase [Acidimicrobiales bacterium]
MLLHRVASTSAAVAATSARNDKIRLLAETLADLEPDEIAPVVAYLSGEIPQGRIGVGWATAAKLVADEVETPTLTVDDLDSAFEALAGISGPGSVAARDDVLRSLLSRATAIEVAFVRRLIVGEVRQGALAGVVTGAIVAASTLRSERGLGHPVKLAALRRAAMLLGDLSAAAELALGPDGHERLAAVGLEVLRGIEPMLAATSASASEAIADVGMASVEWKLDGARVQVHRAGDEVRVLTRNLNDVTDRLPDVVAVARSLPVESIILDGEVLGLDADAAPRPFQDTMATFGTESGPRFSLLPYFFDVLHLDGVDLIDEPLSVRSCELDRVAAQHRIPAVVTDDPERAEAALAEALASGHEGVMVKAVDGRYEAGRRGKSWRKVKPVYTYDLVVLGVERGNGRRKGTLSNLHLGARDSETGEFVMVGKTFKGLTDELLAWQTTALAELAVSDDGYTIMVRPELVIEIAIDGVQRSTRYPGGVALRFARVKGYRPDRSPESADTITTLQALL